MVCNIQRGKHPAPAPKRRPGSNKRELPPWRQTSSPSDSESSSSYSCEDSLDVDVPCYVPGMGTGQAHAPGHGPEDMQGKRRRLDGPLEDEESRPDDTCEVDFRTEVSAALDFGLGLTDPLKHRLQYGTWWAYGQML
jgi:hypothetical protein